MSSKFISERKVQKGSSSFNMQSNIFDSKNILDRDKMNVNNSFLPDIHLVNAGIEGNMR